MWTARRTDAGDFAVTEDQEPPPRYAFIGVRSCDLHAIAVQDRVFLEGGYVDEDYRRRREGAFVVAVNCGQAAATCFCVSMETGPRATAGFDLALTEVLEDGGHRFVVEIGSERGADVLAEIAHRDAQHDELQAAERAIESAAAGQTRVLDTTDIRNLLYRNLDHPRWDEVADRCLSCGNCTMVCPTCFCHSAEDVTDLAGEQADRTRRWDSCFTLDHSYVHGGSVHGSVKSRYRQWMTHKLATWIDQFGSSGCVGCGRCIAWCPVAIDLTEEAAAIRATDLIAIAERGVDAGSEARLGEIEIFRGLADHHLDLIAGCAVARVFGAGEHLLREGEPANAVFAIRHGTVALATFVPQRGAVTIETLHDGDVLGWSWLFPPYRTMFDARALGVVRTVAFDGACLREHCEQDPRLGYALMNRFAEVIVERLQATRIRMLDLYGQVPGR